MSDFHEIISVIKEASRNVIDDDKPTKILIGVVKSVKPLSIFVDQKFTLTQNFLILAKNVTDHEITLSYSHLTEPSNVNGPTTGDPHDHLGHIHEYKGTKKYQLLNGLKEGEMVFLISAFAGQKYIVLDRVGENI